MKLEWTYYDSPCGRLVLAAAGDNLCMCDWACRALARTLPMLCRQLGATAAEGTPGAVHRAATQLGEYFRGERREFSVDLRPAGTPFQQRVWQELMRLPYGATATYAGVAQAIGRPEAVRAVANAIGANPLSIFIPCHRVTAACTPGGYAGGLPAKLHLLALESNS